MLVVQHDDDHHGNDDHLAIQLTTLRAALAQFQQEAHTASLKLQHHSLANSRALERTQSLERENTRLRAELALLRATPDPTPHPATIHAQELSLALRRVSDKLSLTEAALLARTTDLAHAHADLYKAKHAAEGAYALAAACRAREEESKIREYNLEHRVRAAEEERKLSDHVVHEYADLVRCMERRPTPNSQSTQLPTDTLRNNSSTITLVDSLAEGKFGLQKLLEEFNLETAQLQAELATLNGKLSVSESHLTSERTSTAHDRMELAKALYELERLRIDDNTAAKMVSRYMKFSQSTATALQSSLNALNARHTATFNTLSAELHDTRSALAREIHSTSRLRAALDELSADIAREAYGRRREVALRLVLVGREDRVCERLRRLVHRAGETAERERVQNEAEEHILLAFRVFIQDARKILDSLDGDDSGSLPSDSIARIVVAQDAVTMLAEELKVETERRMQLERAVAQLPVEQGAGPVTPRYSDVEGGPQEPSSHLQKNFLDKNPSTRQHTWGTESASRQDSEAFLSDLKLPELPSPHKKQRAKPAMGESSPNDFRSPPDPLSLHNEQTTPRVMLPSSLEKGSSILQHEFHQSPPHLSSPRELLVTPAIRPAIHLSGSNESDILDPLTTSNAVCTPLTSTHQHQHPQVHTHPLLADLQRASHRYDDLQRAFRDCHLALQDLKNSKVVPPSPSPPLASLHAETSINSVSIASPILQAAIEHLYHYTEDARVELEIRAADETLLARGFEALLCIPGAISPSSSQATSESTSHNGIHNDECLHYPEEELERVERDIRAFTDGTESSMQTLQGFTTKLEDIQVDIATIKRAMHDAVLSPIPIASPTLDSSSASTEPARSAGMWSEWQAILGGGGLRPISPAPTFGGIMTSPRLRSSPSFGRPGSIFGDGSSGASNPFAELGLRVPMPSYVHVSPPRPGGRLRTLSAMYMPGLGMSSVAVTSVRDVNGGASARRVDQDMDGDMGVE